jgi:CBS domain-containing protein
LKPAGPGLPIRATANTLRLYAPFGAMGEDDLLWLAARLQLAYFSAGEEILAAERTPVDRLYIVRQGVVQGTPSASLPPDSAVDLVHGAGECFPIAALLARRPSAFRYAASQDAFVYELPEREFRELFDRNAAFRAFCTDYLSTLIQQSRRALRAQAAAALADESRMHAPLREVARRAPVSCSRETPIREVLQTMLERRIGSMVVADAELRPIGIFTEADATRRVALAGRDLAEPIAAVMTEDPVTIDASAPAHVAALAMASRGIRHVVLVDDGKLAGVVSERDLFSLQQASLHGAWGRIRAAQDAAALAGAAAEMRQLIGQLLAQGVAAHALVHLMSALSDGIVQAAVRICAAGKPIGGRYCWMALGSEGRMEQTLATDQDNALVFEQESDRAPLLQMAHEVNRLLDLCGYPLCKGDIMARNPKWCATRDQWRAIFADWIDNPLPQALLNAAIFFDLRAIAGEPGFVTELRSWILARAAGNRAFLRAMAGNALDTSPPVGFWGELRLEDSGEFPGTIDIKKLGARPFVDAARVWALAHALPATGTAERLQAATNGSLPHAEAASATDAFYFIQSLRLQHQYFGRPAAGAENRIAPAALNALDRRILKECFHEAASLQRRLRLDFAL